MRQCERKHLEPIAKACVSNMLPSDFCEWFLRSELRTSFATFVICVIL